MTITILLALAAIVLPVLTYFAGVYRTEKRLQKQDTKERIGSVVSKYLELRAAGRDSGWSGALRAGFATLKNDKEIRDAANIIRDHGEKYPFSSNVNIEGVDLKVLFEYVIKNNLGFKGTPLEQLIEQSNA